MRRWTPRPYLERLRVNGGGVAGDHAFALKAPESFGDRRRRHADAAPELRHRGARISLHLVQQPPIGFVEARSFG